MKLPPLGLAAVQGPCQVSIWKRTVWTVVGLGEKLSAAVNVNVGVAVVLTPPGIAAMLVVKGMACSCCSLVTVTLLLVALGT